MRGYNLAGMEVKALANPITLIVIQHEFRRSNPSLRVKQSSRFPFHPRNSVLNSMPETDTQKITTP